MASTLQEDVPFEKRAAEARRILAKYPDRIPVVCEKAPRSELPDIEKKKFLVPGSMLVVGGVQVHHPQAHQRDRQRSDRVRPDDQPLRRQHLAEDRSADVGGLRPVPGR
mmetsp:Transcript_65860/g.203865  ORF Transcript_65860/g.203865 Transcript_65860/m.203865 type:complete len:109 (-) Transcript_65860:164-490(-)